MIKTKTKCPVCKSSFIRKISSIENTNLLSCRNCQTRWLHPLPKNISKGDDYSNLNINEFFDYLKDFRIQQYNKDLSTIKTLTKGKSILDIGCAQGWFLKISSQKGYQIDAVEPSSTVSKIAQKNNPKSKVYTNNFLDLYSSITKKYSIVTLWSVLEHTTNPVKILKAVNKLLTKDGLIAIRVPCSSGLIPNLIILLNNLTLGKINKPIKSLFEYDCHYKHFFHYNLKSLKYLLEKTGYQVIKHERNISFDNKNFHKRICSSKKNELTWASFPLTRLAIDIVVKLSKLFRLEDEIVVFAKKHHPPVTNQIN